MTTGETPRDELEGQWRPLADDWRCDPSEPGPEPVEGWECRPTDRFEQSLPYIANAHAGDFALSAGCGMIGQLLRQLSPAQRYSHTGVFVQSQDRIRHSTAAEDRLAVGAGFSGLNVRNLRYPQPGVLTQDIVGAYIGEPWRDEEGRIYDLRSFNDEAVQCDGDAEPSPAMIVRWTHGEGDFEDVANFVGKAREMAGHYRFFAYSDGSIGRDPEYDDPEGAPGEDGRNRATVCSSYLWTAAKEAGLTLEASCGDPLGCEDGVFEPRDRAGCEAPAFGLGCAERDAETEDGLYLYRAEERLAAGKSIYSAIRSVARDGFGSGTFLGVPNRVANQVSNCFATDSCTRGDDGDGWRDAVEGRAVSPDDLLFWDRPWGATEPLIERQGLYRRVYTWQPPQRSNAEGEVLVRVFGPDAEPVDGASVTMSGVVHLTDEDGSTLYAPAPVGAHAIAAGRLFGARYLDGRELVEVEEGERAEVKIFLNQATPMDAGKLGANVVALVRLRGMDHEWARRDRYGSHDEELHISLTASEPSTHEEVSFCVDGELRLEQHIHAVLQYDGSVATTLDARLYEGTRCSTGDRDDRFTDRIVVASPGESIWRADLYNDEKRGGDLGYFGVDMRVSPR